MQNQNLDIKHFQFLIILFVQLQMKGLNFKSSINRQPVGLYHREYIETILHTFKSVAFHQIFMENQRQLLCKNTLYDSITGFKSIDIFKHNKIVPFQMKSFLESNGYKGMQVTQRQCQQIIQCLNKNLLCLEHQDFDQLTLSNKVQVRNICLQRNNQIQVQVGTYAKLYQMKAAIPRLLSKFFMKEVQFYRQLLIRKDHFCSKYGGDIYSFSQELCKGKKKTFTFQQLYELGRKYKFYFNQEQFIGLYKRTKSIPHYSPLAYDNISEIAISIESISHLLVSNVKKIGMKQKLKVVTGNSFNIKPPSYKLENVWTRQRNQKAQIQLQLKQEFIQNQRIADQKDKRQIRFKCIYPVSAPQRNKIQLREMESQWEEKVRNMNTTQLEIRYKLIDKKYYFI